MDLDPWNRSDFFPFADIGRIRSGTRATSRADLAAAAVQGWGWKYDDDEDLKSQ